MIVRDLRSYTETFTEYTELRVQENRSSALTFVKGNLVANRKTAVSGVSARVYREGVWGFASQPEMAAETIPKVVAAAAANARFLAVRENRPAGALPQVQAAAEHDFTTAKPRVTPKDLIEFGQAVDSYIMRRYHDLSSRTVSLNLLDMEKSLATSDGSAAYSMIPRAILYVEFSLEKDGAPVEVYDVYGGFGQFEDAFANVDGMFERFDQQYEHLRQKAEGVYPQAGLAECILDADLAGILAHEAIGHTVEADFVRGGSVAGDYLNEQVASPLITLVDFAHHALGKLCPVPVFIDDEGTPAADAVLIDGGVLKGFLHNKESARHFNVAPTGNARAFQFSDEPLIRMRNTAILPGKQTLTEMIASIPHGYYLMKSSNGEADATSEFMFGVVQGYEIHHGKLGKALKNTTISGVAFDMLKTVTMVSDQMAWECGGFCGKKQLIPVGLGGPAIKCHVRIGGK